MNVLVRLCLLITMAYHLSSQLTAAWSPGGKVYTTPPIMGRTNWPTMVPTSGPTTGPTTTPSTRRPTQSTYPGQRPTTTAPGGGTVITTTRPRGGLLGQTITVSDYSFLGSQCPPPYSLHFNRTCYYVNLEEANFHNAEAACNRLSGGHLASFHSRQEYGFLKDLMTIDDDCREYDCHDGKLYDVWTGLRRRNGAWSFTDGSSYNYVPQDRYSTPGLTTSCASIVDMDVMDLIDIPKTLHDGTCNSISRRPSICTIPEPCENEASDCATRRNPCSSHSSMMTCRQECREFACRNRTYFFIRHELSGNYLTVDEDVRDYYILLKVKGDCRDCNNQQWFWDGKMLKNRAYQDRRAMYMDFYDYGRWGIGKVEMTGNVHGEVDMQWRYENGSFINYWTDWPTVRKIRLVPYKVESYDPRHFGKRGSDVHRVVTEGQIGSHAGGRTEFDTPTMKWVLEEATH